MTDETQGLEPVDWRQFFRLDVKSAAALLACAGLLLGLLVALPRWLHGQERADFDGVAVRTAQGIVSTVEISPVSQGGGGLFNAVTVDFDHHQAYYALPPTTRWSPRPFMKTPVRVTYRVGRRTGAVQVVSVTPL